MPGCDDYVKLFHLLVIAVDRYPDLALTVQPQEHEQSDLVARLLPQR